MIRRCQSMRADKWHQLLRRNEKCNRINETEQAKNNKARQPVRISAGEKPFDNAFVISHVATCWQRPPKTFNAQCSYACSGLRNPFVKGKRSSQPLVLPN